MNDKKMKHVLITGLFVVGGLYVWHMWRQHSGLKTAAAGLGINC